MLWGGVYEPPILADVICEQPLSALERLCVDLLKGDPVELPVEDVDFLNVVVGTSYVAAFPGKGQLCVLVPLSESCYILDGLFFVVISKCNII